MKKQTKKREPVIMDYCQTNVTISDFIPEDGYTGSESIYKGESIFSLCENELNHDIIIDEISWQDILEHCFVEMSLLSGLLDDGIVDEKSMRRVVKPFMEETGLNYTGINGKEELTPHIKPEEDLHNIMMKEILHKQSFFLNVDDLLNVYKEWTM